MIYFDSAATNKVNPKVLSHTLPWFTELYGNASSSHDFGEICKEKVEEVREQVAEYLNGDKENVYFCNSSSEANTWFYKTLAKNYETFRCLATDHVDSIQAVNTLTFSKLIPVDENGVAQIADLSFYGLHWLCLNLTNAETGVIQDVKSITELAHLHNCKVFCDLTQSVGHIDIDIKEMGIDACTFGAHKIGGMKGAAILYYPNKPAQIIFGNQENGTHGGTYNVPAIVSLGEALKIERDNEYINSLSTYLEEKIEQLEDAYIVAKDVNKSNHIRSICIPKVKAEVMQQYLSMKEIFVSSGSACNSYDNEPSHVLTAMGMGELANNCIRVSFSEENTKEEVDQLVGYMKTILEVN